MDAAWPSTWPKIAEEIYVFDPSGDVLLILERRPEKDVRDHIDEGEFASKREDEVLPAEELSPKFPLPGDPTAEAPAPDLLEPSAEYNLDTVETEVKAELENDLTKSRSSTDSVSPTSWMVKSRIQEVHMRASSKHLILASATFHTCLGSDKFSEGQKLQAEGNVVIQLPDEDPDAMVILLHIIHGQTRKVPRQVSWKMLSRLAFIVNHRQIHEVVEIFSDIWIENLKQDPLPSNYIPEVLSRLFIFWVFQKKDDFRCMSQILECESDHSLDDRADEDLPVPASIIRNIQQKRLHGIESAIQVIHDLIAKYSGPEIICCSKIQFACDAMLLGSLVKSSTIIGISPWPKNPYPGMTFKTLAEQIRKMQVLDQCKYGSRSFHSSSNNHGIKDLIKVSINSLEDGMCGLELESFLPKETRKTQTDKEDEKQIRVGTN